jgi:hypothetical protein
MLFQRNHRHRLPWLPGIPIRFLDSGRSGELVHSTVAESTSSLQQSSRHGRGPGWFSVPFTPRPSGDSTMLSDRTKRHLALCAALSLVVNGSPALAQASNSLQDLVGAKGAGGEADLERRGYTHIDTSKSRDSAYSYWWSNEKSSCVRVTTRDGRYQALIDVDASDCGQTKKESGMSDGAKVALGAAALLGVAALVHKSHDRDDRNYDERQTADFERGYRDGLYNNSFNNRGGGGEYADGYNKGVDERTRQSNYRYSDGNSNYGSGWTRCAAEGDYCRVDGTARIRFGADNRFEYRNVTGGVLCSVREFGDPARGIKKSCEYLSHGSGYGNVNFGNKWEYCGSEGGYCSFSGPGEVRFGINGRFVSVRAINGIPCDLDSFERDPARGQKKQCFVRRGVR